MQNATQDLIRLGPMRKISARIDRVDSHSALTAEQNRTCTFTQDRAARRITKQFDWRFLFQQSPFVISVAKHPIRFFGTDDEAEIERVILQ